MSATLQVGARIRLLNDHRWIDNNGVSLPRGTEGTITRIHDDEDSWTGGFGRRTDWVLDDGTGVRWCRMRLGENVELASSTFTDLLTRVLTGG